MKTLVIENAVVAGTDNPENLYVLHRSRMAVRIINGKITEVYEIATEEGPAAILASDPELELEGIGELTLCCLNDPEFAAALYYPLRRNNGKIPVYDHQDFRETGEKPAVYIKDKSLRNPVCLYPLNEKTAVAVDSIGPYITEWKENE